MTMRNRVSKGQCILNVSMTGGSFEPEILLQLSYKEHANTTNKYYTISLHNVGGGGGVCLLSFCVFVFGIHNNIPGH